MSIAEYDSKTKTEKPKQSPFPKESRGRGRRELGGVGGEKVALVKGAVHFMTETQL